MKRRRTVLKKTASVVLSALLAAGSVLPVAADDLTDYGQEYDQGVYDEQALGENVQDGDYPSGYDDFHDDNEYGDYDGYDSAEGGQYDDYGPDEQGDYSCTDNGGVTDGADGYYDGDDFTGTDGTDADDGTENWQYDPPYNEPWADDNIEYADDHGYGEGAFSVMESPGDYVIDEGPGGDVSDSGADQAASGTDSESPEAFAGEAEDGITENQVLSYLDIPGEESISATGSYENYPVDPMELFSDYVNKVLYADTGLMDEEDCIREEALMASVSVNALEDKFIDYIGPEIQEVAWGRRGSAVFEMPLAELFGQGVSEMAWTAGELGLSYLVDENNCLNRDLPAALLSK